MTMGVLSATPEKPDTDLLAASSTSQSLSNATSLARRADVASRSQIRTAAKAESAAREDMAVDRKARRMAKKLDRSMWTTEALNLWEGPGEKTDKLGEIAAIRQVAVTGRKQAGRVQVVIDGQSRWVTADYLSADKPEPEPEGPTLGGTCTNGSSISAGRASLYDIHDVVCANWPEITSYGTWRGDGEHGQGRAIDIMVSGDLGWSIAEFLRANYSALGIEYIIYSQKIWSVERSGEGWRGMSDRGSVTANHYDHVHVTVY
ncbi:SH3 domain-containing protein [Nocardioides sp. J2M5]|uniref:SH3 domain-containing protein n=1 Tax=Nocardioides palaemonis TaxID=2829810 RepID=UPI001BA7F4E6|nr:SH3 domain-containing protein [Nocardioides palaemonis]MBS2938612.1 SH3 domain-containing protein [Nocardioides palaemonis]